MSWNTWGITGFGGAGVTPPNGAPTGNPQYPGLFARYPVRPFFAVAGVDYRVGINTGVTLTDWQAMTNPGIGIGSRSISFYNTTDIVIDGIDFSLHGGAFLYFSNCQGISIQNCYFNGPNQLTTDGGVITFDTTCTDITIQYNEVDGGGNLIIPIAAITQATQGVVTTTVPHGFTNDLNVDFANCQGMTELNTVTASVTVIDVLRFSINVDTSAYNTYTGGGGVQFSSSSTIYNEGNTTITLQYNWLYHFPVRPISMASSGGVVYNYNLFERGALSYNDHLNFLEWDSSLAIAATVEYNTIIQDITAVANGEVFQLYSNHTGVATITNPVVQYNTVIGRTDNLSAPFPPLSYAFHGPSDSQYPTTLDGSGICSNNFFDASGSYGWYYPNTMPPPDWTLANNIDMITNQVLGGDGVAPTLTVQNIAPVVNGGTTIINGVFADGGRPSGFFLIIDGETEVVPDSYSYQLTAGTTHGFFCLTLPTPSVGSHTVSVHSEGSYAAEDLDVAFTVIDTTDPYLTITTPSSGVIEGQSLTISGTYVNAAPTGFTYVINGLQPLNAVAPTIGEGTWSFLIAAPYIINSQNATNPGFWITVTGIGPNTASVTSLPFTTGVMPSLVVWKPYSDYAASTQELTISGYYTGPDPSGLSYYFDSNSPTDAPSPSIGNCNWNFTALAPSPQGNHTVTVIGQGPNTSSATSTSFRTTPQIIVPGTPGAPTTTLVGADLIAIAYTAPTTGSPVTNYEVEYEITNSGDWVIAALGVATTYYAFAGLSLDTTYDVRVAASNLAGTSAWITTTGIVTQSSFSDGHTGAPGVSAQLPDILNSYPARPSWQVAGVDYGVGYPTSTTLVDWQTLSGAGITVGSDYVEFSALTSPVVNAVDFSLHGGAYVLFTNSTTNATVSNCKFGGDSLTATASILTDSTSSGLTVESCIFNAGPTYNGGAITPQCGGTILIQYNLSYLPQYPLCDLEGTGDMTLTIQWNVVEGTSLYKCNTSVGASFSATMAFNTCYSTTNFDNDNVGIDMSMTSSNGTLINAVISNNVLIATVSGAENFWVHGAAVTGSGFLFENWIDSTGAYGPIYGGSFGGWVTPENINLPDNTVLTVS